MRERPISSSLLISFFYQLYYNIISLTGLKITLPLFLLLSFVHNRIPCKHNAWAADNLAPLDILFICIIAYYNMPNKFKIHTRTFVYYFLQKKNIIFSLRKTCSAKTRVPGTFPPTLIYVCVCAYMCSYVQNDLKPIIINLL